MNNKLRKDYLVIQLLVLLWHTLAEKQDYCQNEGFEAECGPDEVIMITSAIYGRMRFSRCIDRDYGYVGQCQQNVLPLADAMCSGKRKCTILIPNAVFDQNKVCPKDLKSYFEVDYKCIKVYSATNQQCHPGELVRVTGASGVLPSILTEERQLGSPDCPWIIQVGTGQRINISIWDFSTSVSSVDTCQAYALLSERDPTRTSTVCGGGSRERHVYTSVTNTLEVRVMTHRAAASNRRFLLTFDALGCGNPPTPTNGLMTRDGNTAHVTCSTNGRSWTLTCRGNTWHGLAENCSAGEDGSHVTFGGTTLPFGVSIVMIVGIALALGVFILIFGLVFLKWQRNNSSNKTPQIPPEHTYQSSSYISSHKPASLTTGGKGAQEAIYATENEYAYIDEVPCSPPPLPQATLPSKDHYNYSGQLYGPHMKTGAHGINSDQHQPHFEMQFQDGNSDHTKYFELDPRVAQIPENNLCNMEISHALPEQKGMLYRKEDTVKPTIPKYDHY